MSPAEEPRAGATDPRTAEQRSRDLGMRLVQRLSGMMRMGQSYQVGNAVFGQHIDGFLAIVQEILADYDEVSLVVLGADLFVNGFRLPMRSSTSVRLLQVVLTHFERRAVAGIKIVKEVERKDVENFFELFMKPEVYKGTALYEACLAAGNDGMVPVVHASTEEQTSDFLEGPEAPPEGEDAWGAPAEPKDAAPARAPKGAVVKGESGVVVLMTMSQ